eukprot:12901836-Prorocentrum_lima.AAC.1
MRPDAGRRSLRSGCWPAAYACMCLNPVMLGGPGDEGHGGGWSHVPACHRHVRRKIWLQPRRCLLRLA